MQNNLNAVDMFYKQLIVILGCLWIILGGCSKKKELQVTATAYNSLPGQTSGHYAEAAWGDTLRPGMKSIAVSRDLIDSGLTHGTKVKIEGLSGKYVVRDKMNARWTKKIDIYMGASEKDAREWGKQQVTIYWRPSP